jgi:hypothetical protein
MKIIGARPVLAAALLLSGLWMPAAFAYTSGHGGGSGGGHASAGHASAGHYGGGGGAHYAGHAYAPRSFVGSRATYVGASRAPATRWAAAGAGGVGHAAIASGPGIRGRAIGPGYGHTSRWGGGYWGGRYWPGAYYGPGFAWFLASVPLYCSTFWWNNIPYYYYNDVYYTWSPTADGYVATDPPPAGPADVPSTPSANNAPYDGAPASAPSTGEEYAPPATGSAQSSDAIPPGGFASGGPSIYAYPAKGQTDQQQAADRAECTQWAATQTGGAVGSPDYRRAAIACFQGRGYSAQ